MSGPRVVVVVGPMGAGKSATSNTLLGHAAFAARRSAGAVTHEACRAESIDGEVALIDTPGLCDPGAAPEVLAAGNLVANSGYVEALCRGAL